jgi:flagellar motor switch protein FliM
MNPITLGRQGSDDPRQRQLRGVHENFAEALSGSLSAFLQTEIGVQLEKIALLTAADFHRTLRTPSGVISFQLEPLADRAILALDCSTVFSLLELLLGGSLSSENPGAGQGQQRNLTEIEWALLEEVVRVLVASLGEAWKTFHAVEFKVLTLENDPGLMPVPDPARPLLQLSFTLRLGGQDKSFQIAVPQTFFEGAAGPDEALPAHGADNLQHDASPQHKLELLGEANVDLEVILEGPAIALRELAGLKAGQVVRFDYPLQKPLRAVVNDTIPIPCQIVNAGRKRAFQVERLP